jgi:hypothetical protein
MLDTFGVLVLVFTSWQGANAINLAVTLGLTADFDSTWVGSYESVKLNRTKLNPPSGKAPKTTKPDRQNSKTRHSRKQVADKTKQKQTARSANRPVDKLETDWRLKKQKQNWHQ